MTTAVATVLPFVAAAGLALQSIFIRIGTERGRSDEALFVVMAVNTVVIVPLVAGWFFPHYGLTPVSVLAFVGTGVIGMLAGRAFLFEGIKRIGASRAEPIKASTPLIASLIAVAVLGETLSVPHLFGILLVVGGVGLISWEATDGANRGGDGVSPTGIAFPAVAAVCFGLEPVLIKIGYAEGTPVFVGAAFIVLSGTVGFVVYLGWRERIPRPSSLQTGSLGWYLLAGGASTLAILAYYTSLKLAPVVFVAPIIQTSPLLVVAISYAFLPRRERVTVPVAVASLVVVGGAILITISG